MPYPAGYTPTTSFADDESNLASGRSTVRTAALDVEFANVEAATDALDDCQRRIQRDDGKLLDLLVEPYALSEQTRAMLAVAGCTPRGAWLTFTNYGYKDLVQYNQVAYMCQTVHNSGPTFNYGFWIAISGDGQAASYAQQAQASIAVTVAAAAAAATSASGASASATNAAASAVAAAASQLGAQNAADSAAALSPVSLTNFMISFLASNTSDAANTAIGGVSLTQLANVITALAGAGLVGSGAGIDYPARTLGANVQDAAIHAASFLSANERAQVMASGSMLDLSTSLAAAQARALTRPMKLMAGLWVNQGFDLRSWVGGLVGEGMQSTTIRAKSSIAVMVNADQTSDAMGVASPFKLEGMTIDCASLASTGLKMRYRHHAVLRDLYLMRGVTGIDELDTFLSRSDNVRVTAMTTGWYLRGANHSSQHRSAAITNCSYIHLLIEGNGTAGDNNDAVNFDGLLVSDGPGNGIDDGGSSVTFTGGYLGENIGGTVYTKRNSGITLIQGGVFSFGYTTNTYAFQVLGGLLVVRAVKFNGQTYASLVSLIYGTGGQIRIESCQFNFPVSGDPVFQDDPLAFGPAYECFAPKAPRQYAVTTNNCTATTTDTGNVRTFTCATLGTGTMSMWIGGALINRAAWLNGAAYLVLVYRSSIAFNIRLSGGAGGVSPTRAIGTLPATAGNLRTYVKLDATLDGAAYTTFEIYSDSVVAVGNYIEIDWVNFSDGTRMPLGNLWKC